jgi:hypothetical protein
MRRGRATLCVVAFVLMAASCDGSSGGETAAPASPTGDPCAFVLPPRPSSSAEVDPHFQATQDIFMTDTGTKPHSAVSKIDQELIFHNETSQTLSVGSANVSINGFQSPPIPPGGTFTWTPTVPVSIFYRVKPVRMVGTLQLETIYDPCGAT